MTENKLPKAEIIAYSRATVMSFVTLWPACTRCGYTHPIPILPTEYADWLDNDLSVRDAFPGLTETDARLLETQECSRCRHMRLVYGTSESLMDGVTGKPDQDHPPESEETPEGRTT